MKIVDFKKECDVAPRPVQDSHLPNHARAHMMGGRRYDGSKLDVVALTVESRRRRRARWWVSPNNPLVSCGTKGKLSRPLKWRTRKKNRA